MPSPRRHLVGRTSEVENFRALTRGQTPYWFLNVYGPGGIGKTVVCEKLRDHAQEHHIPFALVNASRSDLTIERILYAVKAGLARSDAEASYFAEFEREFQEYVWIQSILQAGGGIGGLFDTTGTLKDPTGFAAMLEKAGAAASEQTRSKISRRFALEHYLRGAESNLTKRLGACLHAMQAEGRRPLVLLVDTYEELEALDDWFCSAFVPALPDGIKLVVFGRNHLAKVNFDWAEFGSDLYGMELPELAEQEAKQYLAFHGVQDTGALDRLYQFTGGYPLLLVLVVHLAREAGGWNAIGTLEYEAGRDRVATKLLNRILQEERVREVSEFLEKGVVARWFDPPVISAILEVGLTEARTIYDKLQRHSFVEPHLRGLKFHDKIRELLLARLKFTSAAEYERVRIRLQQYYARQAGLKPDDAASVSEDRAPATGSVYHIHIESFTGGAIGDNPYVSQTVSSSPAEEPTSGAGVAPLLSLLTRACSPDEFDKMCEAFNLNRDLFSDGVSEADWRNLLLLLEKQGQLAFVQDWLYRFRPDLYPPDTTGPP